MFEQILLVCNMSKMFIIGLCKCSRVLYLSWFGLSGSNHSSQFSLKRSWSATSPLSWEHLQTKIPSLPCFIKDTLNSFRVLLRGIEVALASNICSIKYGSNVHFFICLTLSKGWTVTQISSEGCTWIIFNTEIPQHEGELVLDNSVWILLPSLVFSGTGEGGTFQEVNSICPNLFFLLVS